MSTLLHYRSNLRDVFFNLFEFLDIGRDVLGKGAFESMDESSARDALTALEKLCVNEIATSFAASDREPPRLEANGDVILTESLKRSMKAYYDADWHRLELPTHIGGFGAPPSVAWAGFEFVAGAHAAAAFYLFGSFVARTIDRLGTDAQKNRFVKNTVEKRWGGAMVLTEPDAGSDVGAARTRARHVKDDEWEITGVKHFITNGDFDATENVVHLVLARPEGASVGTKGLSMFIVPKYWVEADGTMGARNGMRCTKIEKKMGIRASVTCEMTYGADAPCRGLLVGDRHDGIRQMFHVIENARMAVGVKSMTTLSTAYLNALAYTRERVQGPELTKALDKNSPRVPIVKHADVRRMLMAQKSHAEGMRALCFYVASIQDHVELEGGHGAKTSVADDALNDLLLPLVKGYCSEKSHELLSVALQCFGGAGYCQDYPVEQYLRDQKIDTLYEGTTHIQALDLFFRKVGRDGGATLQGLLGRVRASLSDEFAGDALLEERTSLAEALSDVESIFMTLAEKAQESVQHVGLQGNKALAALAELVIGWLLVRHSVVAQRKLATATGDDVAYYKGKIASARYFCHSVLPNLSLTRRIVAESRLDLLELDDSAFG